MVQFLWWEVIVKVPFILYTDFESILKSEMMGSIKMNKMMTERKGKTQYTGKINTHVRWAWFVHNTSAYGYLRDPLKMYRGKNCEDKFIKHIKNEIECKE